MKNKILIFVFVLIPSIAFAAIGDADEFLDYVLVIIKSFSSILGTLALAFFFWNLIKFIKNSSNGSADLNKSKDMMIWSAVALFMMAGIWSVVAYVQSSITGGTIQSDIDKTPILPNSL